MLARFPLLLALAGATLTTACFHDPSVDGDKLKCTDNDNCLPGYRCWHAADAPAPALGICLKPNPSTTDAMATEVSSLDVAPIIDGRRDGPASPDGASWVDGSGIDSAFDLALPTRDGQDDAPVAALDGPSPDVALPSPDGTDAPLTGGTGGGAGGSSGTGGSGGRGGGMAGNSGTTAMGGITATGGISATGGIIVTGGTAATGGTTSNGSGGDMAGNGGTVATGGITSSSSGGMAGNGGTSATGGTTSSSSSGDMAGNGGTTAMGGTTNSGGGGAGSGGTTATGGTGGTAGAGGTTSTVLGATPPMGWNSWNAFACNGLNETLVKNMADAFVSTGMKDAGYQYVNLDDCWMDGRDLDGKLKPSPTKFAGGIKALADYVHAKGLKLGIYSTPNTKTCAGIYGGYAGGVGSKGNETLDAQTWADWGVDFLKYDKCQGNIEGFAVMRDALKATGRPIFYSINPADQGPYCKPTSCSIDVVNIANMWRIELDIDASWTSIIRLIDKNKPEYVGAGPGHWNDPDMLEVGNGLSDTDGRAHFSMWAIMAAPLITGNNLMSMTTATKAVLTNKEVIAVDQDPLGYQGRVVAVPATNLEVWSKELTGTNTRAVALFNRGSTSASMTVTWAAIGLPAGAATVRDLWAATDLGPFNDQYTATSVASHEVVMLKIVSAP